MSAGLQVSGRDLHTGEARTIQIEDGLIVANIPGPADAESYLAPGLVDLQVNGYGGHDLNAAGLKPETVVALCQELVRRGVVAFLPTLVTASAERLIAALEAIVAARAADQLAADMIVGVHIEGPALSAQDGPRGAHPLAEIRPPSLAEFEAWQQASGGLVALVTVAPEQADALEYISELAARKVLVAIGHSAATPEQIHRAVEAGATLATHLGNGVAANLPRHPNLLWAQLANDALCATLIADGHHLSADVFRTMLRAKGLANCVLISDSVALAGMPPGRYETSVGGKVTLRADGRIGLDGTPLLAGAGLTLAATVPKAAHMAHISLAEALKLASVNPGRLLGRCASLQEGSHADLIRFTQTGAEPLQIHEAVVAGRQILP